MNFIISFCFVITFIMLIFYTIKILYYLIKRRKVKPIIKRLFITFILFMGLGFFVQDDTKTKTQDTEKTKSKKTSNDLKFESLKTDIYGKIKSEEDVPKYIMKLEEVVDGDTIKLKYKGEVLTMQLLMVETPDIKSTTKEFKYYGKKAYHLNKKLLTNAKQIYVVFDQGRQKNDKGHYLVYLFADNNSLNNELLRQGLARLKFDSFKNDTLYDKFYESESLAKKERLNLWSYLNREVGNLPETVEKEQSEKNTNHTNPSIQNDQKDNYNTPSQPNDSKSQPQQQQQPQPQEQPAIPVYFGTCGQMRQFYPGGVPSSHPSYSRKLDRDKDGFACEPY
ncbi:thermonuclease [Staphylococcus massiliensis S46]|uniref:Thermonuclease n=2 Tax=Staphylococcus massiliensis TaxID=555791 RepID=K9ARL8_9STAP|nr:thermonuclease [Staphylococcus massiliensis S46]